MAEIRGNFGSFKEAEAHFRQKVNLPTRRWDDLWQGQHTRAFVAAGVTRDAVLTDLRKAVDDAISKGETLADFRNKFDDIVKQHGWIGGAGSETATRVAWRTSVIYHTNIRTAYQAGRWETLKHFPYLKYKHNSVRNPREQHQAWDGLVLRTDDDWWHAHYPPNGWGCRCTVYGVSEARLKADGRQADTAPQEVDGDPPPEWSYHVGEAASGRYVDPRILEAERGGKMLPLDSDGPAQFNRPELVPYDQTKTALLSRMQTPADLREAFRNVVGGESTAYTDPTGNIVEITDAIIEHWLEDSKRIQGREQYLSFIREVVEQPFEVWAGFALNELTGQVKLRRRYVKGIQVGKNRIVGLIADAIDGKWVSYNVVSGGATGANNLRVGRLLWGR